jgi:hypothetical protein
MMLDYPSLSDFNHERLADKLQEMSGMLQLHPQQLSEALVQQPQVLGASLRAVEQRVGMLQRLFGGLEVVQQVGRWHTVAALLQANCAAAASAIPTAVLSGKRYCKVSRPAAASASS